MFDVGFWELALLGLIALIVVGPERLPSLAYRAGLWVRRARDLLQSTREDIEREIRIEELRKQLHESQQLQEIRRDVEAVHREIDPDRRAADPNPPRAAQDNADTESQPDTQRNQKE